MKIAYLMLFHKDPILLKREIEVLAAEDCGFFVHLDRKVNFREFSTIEGKNVSWCEPRVLVHWAEFSQIQATMLLIRQAMTCDAGYDYFVFLQGSTYPLRSGRYIHRFLQENRDWEFMNLVKMPAPGYPLSKISTLRYPSTKPVRRFVARALAKMNLAKRDFRKYLKGLEPYSGHACWALSRNACQYIVDFTESNPHVEEYFANIFVPEESFFHTILGNSPIRSRIRRNLVYADWSRSIGHHPASLTEEHVHDFETCDKVWIEDEWGPGEMLFARKFSDDRLDLIDRIDEIIRRKDQHSTSTAVPIKWMASASPPSSEVV